MHLPSPQPPKPQASALTTVRTSARAKWRLMAPGSAAAPPTSKGPGAMWISAAAAWTGPA